MSYFLFDEKLKVGNAFILEGDEAHHLLHARRLQPGETFEVQDHGGLPLGQWMGA